MTVIHTELFNPNISVGKCADSLSVTCVADRNFCYYIGFSLYSAQLCEAEAHIFVDGFY
jgi:hypothetical protein